MKAPRAALCPRRPPPGPHRAAQTSDQPPPFPAQEGQKRAWTAEHHGETLHGLARHEQASDILQRRRASRSPYSYLWFNFRRAGQSGQRHCFKIRRLEESERLPIRSSRTPCHSTPPAAREPPRRRRGLEHGGGSTHPCRKLTTHTPLRWGAGGGQRKRSSVESFFLISPAWRAAPTSAAKASRD